MQRPSLWQDIADAIALCFLFVVIIYGLPIIALIFE